MLVREISELFKNWILIEIIDYGNYMNGLIFYRRVGKLWRLEGRSYKFGYIIF